MKSVRVTVLFAGLLLHLSCAKSETPVPVETVQAPRFRAIIVVVDSFQSIVTLDHEDLKTITPDMRMSVKVADPSMLRPLEPGDMAFVEFAGTGEDLKIARIERIADPTVVRGSEVYRLNCSECHGDKGEGGKNGIPLISGHALYHSESENIKRVTNGKRDKMPAFRDRLSPDQIKAVTFYVRNEIQQRNEKPAGDLKDGH